MAENKPTKAQLKQAQARHQSALFGADAQKPTSQHAETQAQQRGASLSQAARQKQQQLSPDEARKLQELQAKNRAGQAKARPKPAPKPVDPSVQQLKEVARRSDLAAQAIDNMKQNIKKHETLAPTSPPRPAQPAAQPAPAPAPRPQPQTQPAPPPTDAAQPQRPAAGKRPAPSPEELDRLLREMARRSAARRAAGGAPAPRSGYGGPGGERPEAAPAPEAPPPAPEITAEEEKSPEKHAEILKGLQAREAAAQRDVRPIPQADQERAQEKPVEATVPIKTEGNAISAAPLHEAISDLQEAMRAHDPGGTVSGVNTVQENMPQHPLYKNGNGRGNHGA